MTSLTLHILNFSFLLSSSPFHLGIIKILLHRRCRIINGEYTTLPSLYCSAIGCVCLGSQSEWCHLVSKLFLPLKSDPCRSYLHDHSMLICCLEFDWSVTLFWTVVVGRCFAAFAFSLAALGVNISANSLSAANDLAALFATVCAHW